MSIAGEIAEKREAELLKREAELLKREAELLNRIAFLEDALMYNVGFVPEYTPDWKPSNPHVN